MPSDSCMRPALLAITLSALVSGCASGGLNDVKMLVREDVQRAMEIAIATQDAAGQACAGAILNHLNAAAATTIPTPNGAFSAFMEARELRRKFSAGSDEGIHNACAPLILDAEITLTKLGLKAVPGGGSAGSLLRR